MHSHNKDTNQIVIKILTQIAAEENKPFTKIKKLFVVKCNAYITRRFWEILATEIPNHQYTDVYHCPGCGNFELE